MKVDCRAQRGQALIELVIVLPVLFILLFNLFNFGHFLYALIVVTSAARTGVQYSIMGGAWATAPEPPTFPMVEARVRGDLAALPNAAAATVRLCKNRNGTVECFGSSSSTTPIPLDPDAPYYVLAAVDVSYPYEPLLGFSDILGIPLTMPPRTINRRAVMRMVQ